MRNEEEVDKDNLRSMSKGEKGEKEGKRSKNE